MSREQRINQILNFLNQQTEGVLISEVGRAVGLKVTPYLRSLLERMEDNGYIYVQWAMHPQYGWSRYYLAVAEG